MDYVDILGKCKRWAKKVLWYAYINDEHFPCSCGLVSDLMCGFIRKYNLLPEYNVYYLRGERASDAYVTCNEEERYIAKDCLHCPKSNECKIADEYFHPHSWIEVEDKKTGEICILDYTVMQFDEECCVYEETLATEGFDSDGLYDFMQEIHPFLIRKTDEEFSWYTHIEKRVKNGNDSYYVDEYMMEIENWKPEEEMFKL